MVEVEPYAGVWIEDAPPRLAVGGRLWDDEAMISSVKC